MRVRLGDVRGGCSGTTGCSIASFGLRVRSHRFVIFINPSNYKGSAALHVVTNLRSVSRNRLVVNSAIVGSITPGSHSVTVMFRGCTLCPRVAMFSGVTFNLGLEGCDGSRVGGHISGTTSVLNLARCLSHGPTTLSNKRERHITLNHTVIHSTGIFLVSRPLSGLSTGLHITVHTRVTGLRHHLGAAAVCMARSRARTVAVTSHVIVVGSKFIRRVNDPGRICSAPIGIFMTKFVKSPTVGFFGIALRSNIVAGNRKLGLALPTKGHEILRSGNCGNGRLVFNVHPRSVRDRRVIVSAGPA